MTFCRSTPKLTYMFSIKVCPKGTYGLACSFKCGHCIKGEACLPNNGTCTGGCMEGFKGSLCIGLLLFLYSLGHQNNFFLKEAL